MGLRWFNTIMDSESCGKRVGNMTVSEIMESYKKMNIDVRKMPPYQGAEKFAQQFKRCSITKDVFVSSSDVSNVSKK